MSYDTLAVRYRLGVLTKTITKMILYISTIITLIIFYFVESTYYAHVVINYVDGVKVEEKKIIKVKDRERYWKSFIETVIITNSTYCITGKYSVTVLREDFNNSFQISKMKLIITF